MYRVLFYYDEKNYQPVRSFLESLAPKSQQKAAAWIGLLEEQGPFLRRPYADKVAEKLYELRIRFSADNIRIIYFFYGRDKIVLLHAFRKKTKALPANEILIAENRMNHWLKRFKG